MMNMNPALATLSTGIVPSPSNGAALAIPGAEGFAEVMAGVAALPVPTQPAIGTDAKLRFDVAPAEAAPISKGTDGTGPAIAAPAGSHAVMAEPSLPQAKGTAIQTDIAQSETAGLRSPVPSDSAGVLALPTAVEGAKDGNPVRRKRETKETPPELTTSAPSSSPMVAPVTVVPALAVPAPVPLPQALTAGNEFPKQRRAAREVAVVDMAVAGTTPQGAKAGETNRPVMESPGFPTIEVGKMATAGANLVQAVPDRNIPAQAQAQPQSQAQPHTPPQAPASPDSRKKTTEPVPASLTAVADIVQNLPPLIQSQVGATTVAAPSAAVRPAVDVGASLSSQVIDMGVGGQWIDRVAKEITALAEGNGHSRFQLSPPNLGRLQIDVWQGEGGGRVQLLTETDEAAMRLQQDRASLQADARLSALTIDRIVIERAPGGLGASPDQGAQAGTGRQHQAGGDTTDRGNNSPSGNPAGQQSAAQQSHNGGGTTGQGKAAPRRDVFNDHTQPDVEDRGPSGRTDDRHVRYA